MMKAHTRKYYGKMIRQHGPLKVAAFLLRAWISTANGNADVAEGYRR